MNRLTIYLGVDYGRLWAFWAVEQHSTGIIGAKSACQISLRLYLDLFHSLVPFCEGS